MISQNVEETEYRGYSIVNTEMPSEEVQRLTRRAAEIQFQEQFLMPTQFKIDRIDAGRTPIHLGRFIDKLESGQPGEFDNYALVRVLDGPNKEILVAPDKITIEQKP